MKLINANITRAKYTKIILDALINTGEDVGLINANIINLPVVTEDGEEGWVEITVKIPKDDDGYEKREDYSMKLTEKAEKEKAAAKAKAKKIERDKKTREKENKDE